MVVNELVPGSGRLHTKLGKLAERNLEPGIQKMLDPVRIYGNDSGSHPGEPTRMSSREPSPCA